MQCSSTGTQEPSAAMGNGFETLSEGAPYFLCFNTKVLYMSSSFWLLGVESRDFSHAEKERTACKAEQIHKMTTIFTQNGPR